MQVPEAASPAERARRELEANPDRPDTRIARAARVSAATVIRARHLIETGQPPPQRRSRKRLYRKQPPDKLLLATALPLMPVELAERGLCARHPEPDLWSSGKQAEREAAQRVCWSCPVSSLCREWAASLPAHCRAGVVYAGQLPRRPAQADDDDHHHHQPGMRAAG